MMQSLHTDLRSFRCSSDLLGHNTVPGTLNRHIASHKCSSTAFNNVGQRHQQLSSRQCRRDRPQAAAAQADPEASTIPFGYYWYETMIILRSDLDAEKRDVELAKFEAFLKKESAVEIDALVRANSQALAYPIKGFWDGIYVLYTYAAHPQTVRKIQKLLSTPAVGEESNILRFMTFRQ